MMQNRLLSLLYFVVLFSLVMAGCATSARKKTIQHIRSWEELTNPVVELQEAHITGMDAIYDQGVWYLFYSASYEDSSGSQSRIIEVSTTDFKEYAEPILSFDGREDGWLGMANPHITRHNNIYYLSFNSLGKKSGEASQLFYMTSRDLKKWTAKTPLAPPVTANEHTTHPALAFNRGKWFLIYNKNDEPQVAMASNVRTPFERLGIGTPSFYSSTDTVVAHKRHQFIRFGTKWALLASGNNFLPYLYILPTQGTSGLGWLTWEGGYPLKVFRREVGLAPAPESAAMVNMKRFGGYVYLFYVMNAAQGTTQERGSSKIEVYRSADLLNWKPAGSN